MQEIIIRKFLCEHCSYTRIAQEFEEKPCICPMCNDEKSFCQNLYNTDDERNNI